MTESKTINPFDMNHTGTIETGSGAVSRGQKPLTWVGTYTQVRAKKLPPLRSQGGEKEISRQTVAEENVSWAIRLEDRNIVPRNMRYVVDGKHYHITNVRPYMDTRDFIVLDTEYRDNQ